MASQPVLIRPQWLAVASRVLPSWLSSSGHIEAGWQNSLLDSVIHRVTSVTLRHCSFSPLAKDRRSFYLQPPPRFSQIIAAVFLSHPRLQNELGSLCDSVFASPPQVSRIISFLPPSLVAFTSFLYRLHHPLFTTSLLFCFSPCSLSLASFSSSEVRLTAVWPT